jgi:p-cumate 2,3-dioxygenase beta subunit
MSGSDSQREVETFLYREARLLDDWRLREWEQLFTDDGRYLVPPVGIENPEEADPAKVLFIAADDRLRIGQRVIRLLKPSAHAEYPHSRTRHLVSNVDVLDEDHAGRLQVTACFVVFRVRHRELGTYMGQYFHTLVRSADSFRIVEKRACLDLDALMPQGALAFIL